MRRARYGYELLFKRVSVSDLAMPLRLRLAIWYLVMTSMSLAVRSAAVSYTRSFLKASIRLCTPHTHLCQPEKYFCSYRFMQRSRCSSTIRLSRELTCTLLVLLVWAGVVCGAAGLPAGLRAVVTARAGVADDWDVAASAVVTTSDATPPQTQARGQRHSDRAAGSMKA